MDLAGVVGQVVELPGFRPCRRRDVHRLPVALADRAAAEQLPAGDGLLVVHLLGLAGQVAQPGTPAHLGHVAAAPAPAGVAHAGEVEDGRRDIHHRAEGVADLPLALEPRIADQRRHADAALGGEGLVQPRRRGGRLGPAWSVPDVGIGAADVLQAIVVVLVEEALQLRAELGEGFEQRAFGAVVGHEQHEGVVQQPLLAQVVEYPADVPVHALDHRRVDLHGPRRDAPLLLVELFPLLVEGEHRMRLHLGVGQP
ncbi:hypothetical protein D3C78_888670 [compost metagenome]